MRWSIHLKENCGLDSRSCQPWRQGCRPGYELQLYKQQSIWCQSDLLACCVLQQDSSGVPAWQVHAMEIRQQASTMDAGRVHPAGPLVNWGCTYTAE
jgi:hypothetical protein